MTADFCRPETTTATTCCFACPESAMLPSPGRRLKEVITRHVQINRNTGRPPRPHNLWVWDHLRQDPLVVPTTTEPKTGRRSKPRSSSISATTRGGRLMSDSRLQELPQEGLTLVRPATSHLTTEHHQPGAAVGSRELGVGGFFTSP